MEQGTLLRFFSSKYSVVFELGGGLKALSFLVPSPLLPCGCSVRRGPGFPPTGTALPEGSYRSFGYRVDPPLWSCPSVLLLGVVASRRPHRQTPSVCTLRHVGPVVVRRPCSGLGCVSILGRLADWAWIVARSDAALSEGSYRPSGFRVVPLLWSCPSMWRWGVIAYRRPLRQLLLLVHSVSWTSTPFDVHVWSRRCVFYWAVLQFGYESSQIRRRSLKGVDATLSDRVGERSSPNRDSALIPVDVDSSCLAVDPTSLQSRCHQSSRR